MPTATLSRASFAVGGLRRRSGSRFVQTAIFVPRGLAGALYWYLLYPLHTLIFSDLARAVTQDAVKREHDA
jgi:hypothetical protein